MKELLDPPLAEELDRLMESRFKFWQENGITFTGLYEMQNAKCWWRDGYKSCLNELREKLNDKSNNSH